MPTPAELKKALQAAGLEIYRTRGDVVHLAERVRENLLMDAGIFVDAARVRVGFLVRAQRTDFPSESDDRLFERARGLAAPAVDRGYGEVEAMIRKVRDPGNEERIIDTWCEVLFEKPVSGLDAAVDEVRFALSIEKAAAR